MSGDRGAAQAAADQGNLEPGHYTFDDDGVVSHLWVADDPAGRREVVGWTDLPTERGAIEARNGTEGVKTTILQHTFSQLNRRTSALVDEGVHPRLAYALAVREGVAELKAVVGAAQGILSGIGGAATPSSPGRPPSRGAGRQKPQGDRAIRKSRKRPITGDKKKHEVLVRRMSATEADATRTAQGLVPKPGSNGPKWVSVDKGQSSLASAGHEVEVKMHVKSGTIEELGSMSVDFGSQGKGESSLPNGVWTKANEEGAYGIGIGLVPWLNEQIERLTFR